MNTEVALVVLEQFEKLVALHGDYSKPFDLVVPGGPVVNVMVTLDEVIVRCYDKSMFKWAHGSITVELAESIRKAIGDIQFNLIGNSHRSTFFNEVNSIIMCSQDIDISSGIPHQEIREGLLEMLESIIDVWDYLLTVRCNAHLTNVGHILDRLGDHIDPLIEEHASDIGEDGVGPTYTTALTIPTAEGRVNIGVWSEVGEYGGGDVLCFELRNSNKIDSLCRSDILQRLSTMVRLSEDTTDERFSELDDHTNDESDEHSIYQFKIEKDTDNVRNTFKVGIATILSLLDDVK